MISSLGRFSWWKAGKRLLWLDFLRKSDIPSEEFLESIMLKAGGSKISAELLDIKTRFLSLATPDPVFGWLIWLFLIKNEKNYKLIFVAYPYLKHQNIQIYQYFTFNHFNRLSLLHKLLCCFSYGFHIDFDVASHNPHMSITLFLLISEFHWCHLSSSLTSSWNLFWSLFLPVELYLFWSLSSRHSTCSDDQILTSPITVLFPSFGDLLSCFSQSSIHQSTFPDLTTFLQQNRSKDSNLH